MLDTHLSIPIIYWDPLNSVIKQYLPPTFRLSEKLNESLVSQLRLTENLIEYALKNKVEDLGKFAKKYFKPDLNIYYLDQIVKDTEESERLKISKSLIQDQKDFFTQIDDYIQSKIKKLSKDMPRIYRNMKDHLLEFQAYSRPLIPEYFFHTYFFYISYFFQIFHVNFLVGAYNAISIRLVA